MVILSEQKLSLAAVARRAGVNDCTVWRWAKRGVRGIKLETYALGGRRWTSVEAFERFVSKTTAALTTGGCDGN